MDRTSRDTDEVAGHSGRSLLAIGSELEIDGALDHVDVGVVLTVVVPAASGEELGQMRGLVVYGAPVEASDPRLSGLYNYVINGNGQKLGTPDFALVESRSWRMENDGGAWTGTTTWVEVGPGTEGPPAMAAEAGILIGEGGYEGLIAIIHGDYGEGNQGEAVILEVPVPPIPEVPEAPAE